MLTNDLKTDLKNQIDQIDDVRILEEIQEFLKLETSADWFNEIPVKAQEGIVAGFNDWKTGNTLSHESVMKSFFDTRQNPNKLK